MRVRRYLISQNGKEWVSQECVAIDYEWLQGVALKEAERQREEREARREKKRQLEYDATLRELDETCVLSVPLFCRLVD